MTTFDDRKQAFENKFIHDEELKFKVIARRNKLLGLWVAEHLGLPPEERPVYAKELVRADFEKPGDEDVIEKILTDSTQRGTPLSRVEILEKIEAFFQLAKSELLSP